MAEAAGEYSGAEIRGKSKQAALSRCLFALSLPHLTIRAPPSAAAGGPPYAVSPIVSRAGGVPLRPGKCADRGHDLNHTTMPTEQYHEPPEELSAATRTFARMITSLAEECEAIGWYEQRISLEKDSQARAIMKNAQHEEMKHFGMDLEFLLRRKPQWRETLRGILFTEGDIVEHGDEAEEASEDL